MGKIRIVRKNDEYSQEYEIGDVFEIEGTWYGGVHISGKSGVPVSLDREEYVMLEEKNGGRKSSVCRTAGGMKEIPITELENVKIGNAEDAAGGTGCTVFLFENGAPAGLDVRGGGPASGESELLKPLASAQSIHGILLAGGSAFGLTAAGGVRKYLEERDIGFDVGVGKVPLVCQSDLFDLTVGDGRAWPDENMAYQACKNAEKGNYRDGNFGAGTGATVGKMAGMDRCMKSGIGSYALQAGELQMGAVVAVNALGDVFDWRDGRKAAGMLSPDKKAWGDSEEEMLRIREEVENKFVGNTTLAVILTNGKFDKTRLCRIAAMGHDGYARSIRPVHTSADGDSIYAVSLGEVEADPDMAGVLAARVVSEAILRAVQAAEGAYGFPAASDIRELMEKTDQ